MVLYFAGGAAKRQDGWTERGRVEERESFSVCITGPNREIPLSASQVPNQESPLPASQGLNNEILDELVRAGLGQLLCQDFTRSTVRGRQLLGFGQHCSRACLHSMHACISCS